MRRTELEVKTPHRSHRHPSLRRFHGRGKSRLGRGEGEDQPVNRSFWFAVVVVAVVVCVVVVVAVVVASSAVGS